MSPNISIIIPIYKTEQYLRECLDSVLAQTYTDWECLLIDDGSPDNCGVICDEYADRDSRFRVFHKENGGVSSARNVGLDNCVCEYVTFVDSDDTIAPDYLEAVNDFEGDLMILGYCNTDGTPANSIRDGIYMQDNYKLFVSNYLISAYLRVPWAKIFKRSIINKIRFDASMPIAEDTVFCISYLQSCHNIKVDTNHKYIYRPFLKSEKEYWNLSSEQAIYCLKSINEQYNKLLISVPSYMRYMYYFFREIVFQNNDGVHRWFGEDVVKEIFVKNIRPKMFFYLSLLRWKFL